MILAAGLGWGADWMDFEGSVPSPVLLSETIVGHEWPPTSTSTCSIVYWNTCSGWIWAWASALVVWGVVFDLPADCGALPGVVCENTGFWWYWLDAMPGYGYTVDYRLYNADESLCLVGPPLNTLPGIEPLPRWNSYPGLGPVDSGFAAITVKYNCSSIPKIVTDNAHRNSMSGCAPVPEEVHSVMYDLGIPCPAFPVQDRVGPCNILMDATFSCEETSIEPASWGAIKALFR